MAFKQHVPKDLACKECGETVKNVGSDASAVICWKCVNAQLNGYPIEMHDMEQPPETCKK